MYCFENHHFIQRNNLNIEREMFRNCLNQKGIACFAELFFLLEGMVKSHKMISLLACHSRLFLYPMNVRRCYWVLIHSTLSISLCLLDADIEPEDQEIEHYYTQHHDHDRNGKITHHPLEGLYQNTSISKIISNFWIWYTIDSGTRSSL